MLHRLWRCCKSLLESCSVSLALVGGRVRLLARSPFCLVAGHVHEVIFLLLTVDQDLSALWSSHVAVDSVEVREAVSFSSP